MPTKCVTPADTLPVAVTTVLRHLRALQGDADLASLYARAAVAAVEDYTGRALIVQPYILQTDSWPSSCEDTGINFVPSRNSRKFRNLRLPRSPLVAISAVKYYPEDGSAQATLDVANYAPDLISLPGRVVFNDSAELPALAARFDAVTVEFTAGEGTKPSQINPMLQVAVLQLARHFFDNPGTVDAEGKAFAMPLSYQTILRSQRIA